MCGDGVERKVKQIDKNYSRISRPRAFDCLLTTNYSEIDEDDNAKQAVDESIELKG